MDNTLYVGLSNQLLLERELDIAANNLANVNTTGFKVEQLMATPDPATPPTPPGGTPQMILFVADNGVARDFSQGPLQQTDAPLDLAIMGQGFFQIQTANGTRYTRDGRFAKDNTGRLVTQAGDPVLDASSSPISLNPQGGTPMIGGDGTITQTVPGQANAQVVGRVGVISFADLSQLSKEGDGYYSESSGQAAQPVTGQVIRQGMLEASNVQPIVQVTDLIRISRAYDMVANMMNSTATLSDTAVQRLGSLMTTQ
ncbi:MAG TPA: flagellar basal-body rod protein FlgF [Caulobacteraceae bacterium]|jgi:flagellar basal-body rod protein FlgF|nr:flagellar basal-body rod protein FlgF [Caulobacteraceae bacterium]